VAVLCAGSAQIEECEKNPEKTRLVNVAGLSALADILMSRRVFVVFLSSSTVFDGTLPFRKPEDTVAPRTEYGRQKVAMEQFLLKSSRPSAIIRLTKTLSPDFPLIRKWARQLRDGEPIHPFYDMTMSPVSLTFVTGVLYRLLENRASGVWHVSGNLDITYEAAARYIARRIGADVNQIHPISAHSALGDHVFIPEYTSLETGRLSRELSLSSPDVWRSMDTVLHQ
jgi:dTDP-4-dehydrorhamnose reductase